jgi:2-methylcitrate dehydratase PrpD
MNQDKNLPPEQQVTRLLARHIAQSRYDDLPAAAVAAGRRGVLDWLGCALAGSRHATLDITAAVMQELNGQAVATVLARNARAGLLEAATINGQMGHVLDFDDTHMGGVVLHASSPILAALLALAETHASSGKDLLLAYACGFEAGVRIGQASPGHHRGGWHLTGTLGSFAAGAACARLLGLDEQKTIHALGISGTQAAGMQQNRGTMCKSFHAGKAAANGILAAKLAQRGFDSSAQIIEGERGFCRIYSDVANPQAVADALGERWEITRNGHKPYACGVVLHPAIDALIGVRNAHRIDPAAVTRIALRVHPLVLSITAVTEPRTGLKSKFSISHCAAVALIDGAAGRAQFTDAKALDPAIAALRQKCSAVADDSLRNDEAYATVEAGGATYEFHVPHASGTVDNPMDDEAIRAKFVANAEPVIGAQRSAQVCEWVGSMETRADLRELMALLA